MMKATARDVHHEEKEEKKATENSLATDLSPIDHKRAPKGCMKNRHRSENNAFSAKLNVEAVSQSWSSASSSAFHKKFPRDSSRA